MVLYIVPTSSPKVGILRRPTEQKFKAYATLLNGKPQTIHRRNNENWWRKKERKRKMKNKTKKKGKWQLAHSNDSIAVLLFDTRQHSLKIASFIDQ